MANGFAISYFHPLPANIKDMQYILAFLLALAITANSLASATDPKGLSADQIQKLEQLVHDVSMVKDSQVEIRRDQLNYKIEKDLLKEAYSSSLQTVNVALTFILGLLAVLGYLGIRDIGSLKKEYSEHLDQLGKLKIQLEADLLKVTKEQTSVREELKAIFEANKDQGDRIKVLELQKEIATLIINRAFDRALQYLSVALEIAPKDVILLNQKAHCLIKKGRHDDAIDACRSLIS